MLKFCVVVLFALFLKWLVPRVGKFLAFLLFGILFLFGFMRRLYREDRRRRME